MFYTQKQRDGQSEIDVTTPERSYSNGHMTKMNVEKRKYVVKT